MSSNKEVWKNHGFSADQLQFYLDKTDDNNVQRAIEIYDRDIARVRNGTNNHADYDITQYILSQNSNDVDQAIEYVNSHYQQHLLAETLTNNIQLQAHIEPRSKLVKRDKQDVSTHSSDYTKRDKKQQKNIKSKLSPQPKVIDGDSEQPIVIDVDSVQETAQSKRKKAKDAKIREFLKVYSECPPEIARYYCENYFQLKTSMIEYKKALDLLYVPKKLILPDTDPPRLDRNQSDDAVYGTIEDDQTPAANPNNVIAKVTPDAQGNGIPSFFPSDPDTTPKKISHRSKSLPPAKRDSKNDPSLQENIPETIEDKSSGPPPDDNVLYNFVTARMLDEDIDDDNIRLVTSWTKTRKKNSRRSSKKKERICIKNHHLLDGKVTLSMLKKYLCYLDSLAFTDGNEFIDFMSEVKERSSKDLYEVHPRCPQELRKGVELYFKDLERMFDRDQLATDPLYQYWLAVSKLCRFPFAHLIGNIACRKKKQNDATVEEMTKEMTAFIDDMCTAKKDSTTGELKQSRNDMNNVRFMTEERFFDDDPNMKQLKAVKAVLQNDKWNIEIEKELPELVYWIAKSMKVDRDDKNFLKLNELLKWSGPNHRLKGRLVVIQRASFHQLVEGIKNLMGFENKALLEEAIHEGDKHGQKEASKEQLGIEEEYLVVDKNRILESDNQSSLRFDYRKKLNRRDKKSPISKDVLVQVVHAKQSFHEVKETLKQFKSCSLEEVPTEKLESVRSARSWDEYHHRLDISSLREMKLQEGRIIFHMNQFLAMFEKLKAFKEEYKHTDVRQLRDSTPDTIALSRWCKKHRRIYYKLTIGKKPHDGDFVLTPEKFILLDSIGFNWDSSRIQEDVNLEKYRTEVETNFNFKRWLTTYTNLKNFLEVNGRYPLPSEKGSEEEALTKWIYNQKHAYHNQDNGKTQNVMSQNRILRLTKLSQWNFGVHAMASNRRK